jgi:transcription elongation factor GreA
MNAVSAQPVGEGARLITADGYQQLHSELESLRTRARHELRERLREARADGHLADNPALFDLLEEQHQLERRIAVLEGQVAAAQIVEPARNGFAEIGSCVRVRDDAGELAEYELVGTIEPNVGNGRVSVAAPVGRALVGRKAGETVEVKAPQGTLALEILSVQSVSPPRSTARKAA